MGCGHEVLPFFTEVIALYCLREVGAELPQLAGGSFPQSSENVHRVLGSQGTWCHSKSSQSAWV